MLWCLIVSDEDILTCTVCYRVQVADDDFYEGPLESDYETDDSNGLYTFFFCSFNNVFFFRSLDSCTEVFFFFLFLCANCS